MFRLALLVVLVVAAASAKHGHGKTERRNNDAYELCFRQQEPFSQCFSPSTAWTEYPVMSNFSQVRSFDEAKRVLKEAEALRGLCREGTQLLTCVNNALKRAPEECQTLYKRHDLTTDNVDKALSLIALLCTDENIRIATRNLDCAVNESLIADAEQCTRLNPYHDCSRFENTGYDSDEVEARSTCYRVKYQRNCDAKAVVKCASDKVTRACTDEAGQLVTLAGNGIYERIPICRGPRGPFSRLMKFFKK